MKHTPGPWQTIQSIKDRKTFIIQAHKNQGAYGSYQIAKGKIALNADYPMTMANSKLIAAAPDLLEACKAAKKHLEPDLVEPGKTVFWKLVSAIKKAT